MSPDDTMDKYIDKNIDKSDDTDAKKPDDIMDKCTAKNVDKSEDIIAYKADDMNVNKREGNFFSKTFVSKNLYIELAVNVLSI